MNASSHSREDEAEVRLLEGVMDDTGRRPAVGP